MATTPDSMFPLSETYIAEALATELCMGLRPLDTFKDKCARITDEPIGHNCVICQTPLNPNDANALIMSANAPENRRIIRPKYCSCSFHVGCLEGNLYYDRNCPLCRRLLLIRPLETAPAPYIHVLQLRTGHFKGSYNLFDDRVKIDSKEVTGAIALSAFALWTLKDEKVDEVLTTIVIDGEDCPILHKVRPFALAGTEEGHAMVEAMIRIAFKHDGKRRCIEDLRDSLAGAPWVVDGTGPNVSEAMEKFAGLVADMGANSYASGKGLLKIP